MLHKRIGIFLLFVGLSSWTAGCQPGRFTEDRRYVGDPERPAATSEPIGDTHADPGASAPADR